MTAKAIPIVVSVIADADDVTLFNRLFDEKLTRSSRVHGLLARIGPPLADGPLAPSRKLYMHEASFSEAGVVWLKDRSRQDAVARRLDLTPEETFGLMLAFWRSLYPVGLPRVRDKDYGCAVECFAVYKAGQAKAAGHDADAMRLLAEYHWPGNVRQLENSGFRAVILCEGELLQPEDFPQISGIVSPGPIAAAPALKPR